MTSARLGLPYLQPGQAQKELFHNEALGLLDIGLHAVAQEAGVNTPPSSPVAGQCWIVGTSPSGPWSGRAETLAGWTEGGWRFLVPPVGMTTWVVSEGCWAYWDGTAWAIGVVPATSLVIGGDQIVGARQPSIAVPSGGSTIDSEARAAITSMLAALSAHGLIHP